MGDARLSKLMADGNYYLPSNGHFVSENQRRTAEILKDYNSELELQWIPPGDRSAAEVAFRVVHRAPGRPPYVVLTAEEADPRLLARLFMMDQEKAPQALKGHRDLLSYIDHYNAAIELTNAKKTAEKRQEAVQIARDIMLSKKIHYKARVNGELLDFNKPYGGRFG